MNINNLYIKSSEFTPGITFKTNGIFEISGVSRPEDVAKFYEVPIAWLKNFTNVVLSTANKYQLKIHCTFSLKYFNSASAKHILLLLEQCKKFDGLGFEVKIDWYYDEADEQLLEDGQDLSEAVEMPFNFIQLED